MLASRKCVEVCDALFQPLFVWVFSSKRHLHFIVVNETALCGINEEHAAWLQTALANNARLVDVQHTRFRCKNDEVVIGNPIATWAKTIAVKHCTNESSVGETHVGWAVPWLHHRRMELIERALLWIHALVVFPCFRNHHEQRMRKRTAGEMQQFQYLVKACGVRHARCTNRERAIKTRNQVAGKQCFTCAHPVAVALHCVDFTVVCNEAIWVSQWPRWEGVR
ncbi:unannotated protein [freshwater metagenome]|uniref:Unannotated protein n=1 Tax=freshwater metagenome TaxID=449393 RepID=A0A6J6HUR9_9ZZZZ